MKNSKNWREEIAHIADVKGLQPNRSESSFSMMGICLRKFAEEVGQHGKQTQVRERDGNVELSIVGKAGLEMEVALSADDGGSLWVFSKRVVMTNFPLSAAGLESEVEALQFLTMVYRAAKTGVNQVERS